MLTDGKQIADGSIPASKLASDAVAAQTPPGLLDMVAAASDLEFAAAQELILYRLMGGK